MLGCRPEKMTKVSFRCAQSCSPRAATAGGVVYGRLRLSTQCSTFELSKPNRLIPARSPYKSVGETHDVRGNPEVKWVVLGVQAFGSGVVGFLLLEGKSLVGGRPRYRRVQRTRLPPAGPAPSYAWTPHQPAANDVWGTRLWPELAGEMRFVLLP